MFWVTRWRLMLLRTLVWRCLTHAQLVLKLPGFTEPLQREHAGLVEMEKRLDAEGRAEVRRLDGRIADIEAESEHDNG